MQRRRKPRWKGWLWETLVLAAQLWIMVSCIGAINTTDELLMRLVYAAVALLMLFRYIVPRFTKFYRRGLENRRI